MVTWKDYLKQSQSDMESCLLLYEKGHYGNSAYFMQQALEKRTKSFMIRHQLAGASPLKKTHLPMMIVQSILPSTQRLVQLASKYNIDFNHDLLVRHDEYVRQAMEVMSILDSKRASQKSYLKQVLWKKSLHIPLDSEEQSIMEKYPYFQHYYIMKLDGVIGSDSDPERGVDFVEESKLDPQIKDMGYYWTAGSYGPLIAATFPHEDIGRYPVDIRVGAKKELSTSLYVEYKDELKKLIDVVSEGIGMRQG